MFPPELWGMIAHHLPLIDYIHLTMCSTSLYAMTKQPIQYWSTFKLSMIWIAKKLHNQDQGKMALRFFRSRKQGLNYDAILDLDSISSTRSGYWEAMYYSMAWGHTKQAAHMLAVSNIDIFQEFFIMSETIARGWTDCVKQWFQREASEDDIAGLVEMACYYGHLDMLEFLLTKTRSLDHGLLSVAIEGGHAHILKRLFETRLIDPSSRSQMGFVDACSFGSEEMLDLFLSDSRIQPDYNEYQALKAACENGNLVAVVKLIDRVVPNQQEGIDSVIGASEYGHVAIVQFLLERLSIDPSLENNLALISAAANNNLDVVDVLLKDPRVIHVGLSQAYRYAKLQNRAETMKRLEMTDPSFLAE